MRVWSDQWEKKPWLPHSPPHLAGVATILDSLRKWPYSKKSRLLLTMSLSLLEFVPPRIRFASSLYRFEVGSVKEEFLRTDDKRRKITLCHEKVFLGCE